jgi:hypothetical protein
MGRRWKPILSVALLICVILLCGCSQSADDDPVKQDDSVVIQMFTEHDDLFGFDIDEQVGRIWLSDSRGLVGSPINTTVIIDQIESFDDSQIELLIELQNPDAIKLDSFITVHSFKKENSDFRFIIPQVRTVPAVLNFMVYMTVGTPGDGKYFEAQGFYQFYANQGTPAT